MDKYSSKPGWKALQDLVKKLAPDKWNPVREQLRQFYTQEKVLRAEVEKAKPALDYVARIEKSGVDLNNTVELIEGWQRGDEGAEKILTDLLTDLQTRRGTILSDTNLVTEMRELQTRLDEGDISQEQFTKRKTELLELQQGRAAQKRSVEDRQRGAKAAQQERVNTLVAERTNAISAWEKRAQQDPDYAEIQDLVLDKARILMDERQAKAKDLLPASEMTAVLDEALTAVKSRLGKLLPQRGAMKPVHNNGNSSLTSRRQPANERERLLQRMEEMESSQ